MLRDLSNSVRHIMCGDLPLIMLRKFSSLSGVFSFWMLKHIIRSLPVSIINQCVEMVYMLMTMMMMIVMKALRETGKEKKRKEKKNRSVYLNYISFKS